MNEMSKKNFYEAHLSRDPRFDGKFFVAVKTTKIYCRPICPARKAKLENLNFYHRAEEAEEKGFRPCLRCRPETAPRSAAWQGTSATVQRALRIMDSSAREGMSIAQLAENLGIGERWLHELFVKQLGVSPQKVLLTKKLDTARQLLDETSLSITEIALSSGFQSVRRFNDAFKERFGSSPRSLRKSEGKTGVNRLTLNYRPPYNWNSVLSFLEKRSLKGIEFVEAGVYHRSVTVSEGKGWLAVRKGQGNCLVVDFGFSGSVNLVEWVSRLRNFFDLDADPERIASTLKKDKFMKPIASQFPGLRVPGCWDGFEIALRAIVGQQISVKGAKTILERLILRCGGKGKFPTRELEYYFPTPEQVLKADLKGLGLTQTRLQTLKALAKAVHDGDVNVNGIGDYDETCKRLLAIKGIGPWTVDYIAMRALGNPNAFPESDLELKKQVSRFRLDPSQWEPWRSYGAIALWSSIN